MAYGSKQLRSSLVRQSVVDTPPILDTLQKKNLCLLVNVDIPINTKRLKG
jgi:hypothetical protein